MPLLYSPLPYLDVSLFLYFGKSFNFLYSFYNGTFQRTCRSPSLYQPSHYCIHLYRSDAGEAQHLALLPASPHRESGVGAKIQLVPGGGRCEAYNSVHLRCIKGGKSQVNTFVIPILFSFFCFFF